MGIIKETLYDFFSDIGRMIKEERYKELFEVNAKILTALGWLFIFLVLVYTVPIFMLIIFLLLFGFPLSIFVYNFLKEKLRK